MQLKQSVLTVMRRVFEGGEGDDRAGRSERSRERVGEWRRLVPLEEDEEVRERGGVETSAAMLCVFCMLVLLKQGVEYAF